MSSSSGSLRGVVSLLFAMLALVLYSPNVRAQFGQTSSVSGQVLDQQGGVVVGATVTLTDTSTKTSHSQDTNDTGRYTFANVLPGFYDLSVTKTGFQTLHLQKQEVIVGVPLTLNFTLKVGEATVTVEVVSTPGAELQTNSSTMGTTLGGKTLLDLPAVARDASALVTYQAGVTRQGNVAGQENDQNTFMIDGANNSQDMDGGSNSYLAGFGGATNGTVPTPAESVEEFKVNTNNQNADFNSSAGGQVQVVTKRGTDAFHGSAYDYYQANWLDANTFANNASGTAMLKQHQNRFGGSLGGPLLPMKILGGKTYFFANYEARRFPNSTFITKSDPTALMRAGVLLFPDDANNNIYYNLTNSPVAVGGNTYPVGIYNGTTATSVTTVNPDPRGLGVNAYVAQIWNKYMPLPNFANAGDQLNVLGYQGNAPFPIADDFGVIRVDHDLGTNWHLFSSYRIYKLRTLSTVQTDIGGFVPGDTFGNIAATGVRPSEPSLFVIGLSGQLTANLTNNFTWNYTRDDWQWSDVSGNGSIDQIPGVPGALEIGGETNNALIPLQINTQQTRQRIWDGHDYYYKDDLSYMHGNHFVQFGGQFNRNHDFHTRNDNGSTTDVNTVYLINSGSINFTSLDNPLLCPTASGDKTPNCLPNGSAGNFNNEFAEILGLVSQPQTVYSRVGPNLALQPQGTPAFDNSAILTYDAYFSDSWHMKPSFTLTYGLNYGIQMPPVEEAGKQVMLVDSAGNAISTADYLQSRYNAAVSGSFSSPAFTPELGYATVPNVGTGRKYPYNPYYAGFAPRVSAAWSPDFNNGGWKGKLFGHNSSVIRGGWSRIYTRDNGVDLVLVPLLGVGLMQAVACVDPVSTGTCAGPNGSTPTTAFRIGTDGNTAPLGAPSNTLSQPIFPGVNGVPGASDTLMLDSAFHPGRTDQFNFSIQRTLPKSFLLEVGYIGIRSRNLFMGVNLDQVPYMSTVNGQSFAQAYANIEQEVLAGSAVTPQSFIEGAMAGNALCTGSSAPFATCTAALMASKSSGGLGQTSNFQLQSVYNIWQTLSKNFNTTLFPPFNPSTGQGGTESSLNGQAKSEYMVTSLGWSNYNAAFISVQKRTSAGLTVSSNFTYSHALGTIGGVQAGNGEAPSSAWNPGYDYGTSPFDHRFILNLLGRYELPFGKGQNGFLGRVIGGWSVSPILTWQSGAPIIVDNGSGQEFGQEPSESNDSQSVLIGGRTALGNTPNGTFFNVVGVNNIGTNSNPSRGGYGVNYFQNPSAGFALYRPAILGLDTSGGGNGGEIANPNSWNLDMNLVKDIKIREQLGVTLSAQFLNALNHVNWSTGGWSTQNSRGFGVLNPSGNARVIEMGLRVYF